MQKTSTLLYLILLGVAAACTSTRNTTTQAQTEATTAPKPVVKSTNGIYPPGAEELSAVKALHPDATQEALTEGYVLYAKGACTNCHGAKNIYQYNQAQWKEIMDDMAPKAQLTDNQKDAVVKFIAAIKAAKPGTKG